MSVNPSPLQPAALACPICGEPILIVESLDKAFPDEQQRVEYTEQMVLFHVQIQHPMDEVLRALGTARNALFDIRPAAMARDIDTVLEAVERGLAGK